MKDHKTESAKLLGTKNEVANAVSNRAIMDETGLANLNNTSIRKFSLTTAYTAYGAALGGGIAGPFGAIVGAAAAVAVSASSIVAIDANSDRNFAKKIIKQIGSAVANGEQEQLIEGLNGKREHQKNTIPDADKEFYQVAIKLAETDPHKWPQIEKKLLNDLDHPDSKQAHKSAALTLAAYCMEKGIAYNEKMLDFGNSKPTSAPSMDNRPPYQPPSYVALVQNPRSNGKGHSIG